MTKCNCGFRSEEPFGYTRKFCDSCISDKEIGIPMTLDYENIPEYGKVLKSRIGEMSRRVIIDDKSDKTSYHCGRLGENGKVQEREPNY